MFSFANGVAIEDGQRAKTGLDELITRLEVSSPSSST